jgi:hypothetical protein
MMAVLLVLALSAEKVILAIILIPLFIVALVVGYIAQGGRTSRRK